MSSRARTQRDHGEIRPARPDEADLLSALAIRSKAHWGYTPEMMQTFETELTLAPDQIEPRSTHLLSQHSRPLGFYTLVHESDEVIELEHLFIDPDVLRRGLGSRLLAHAIDLARRLGFRQLKVQSDPNAAGFYTAHRLPHLADIPSSIPGRSIPCFQLDLGEDLS